MSNKKLLATGGVLAVVLIALVALQSQDFLQGRFTSTVIAKPSCADMPASTIYVSSTAGIRTDGTAENPYRTLSAAQSRLETDSTVQGVCLTGTLTGTLNLDDALSTSLTLKGGAGGATLGSSTTTSEVLSYSGGTLSTLKVQNLTFKDPVQVSDLSTVEFSSDTFSSESGTALAVRDSTTVSLEKSTITPGSSGGLFLYTVGTANVQNNFILGQTSYGIKSEETKLNLYHNSFYNNAYAAYLDGKATLKNNIFYSKTGQYALSFEYYTALSTPTAIQVDLSSDYNLFYSIDGNLAYIETTEEMNTGGTHTSYAGYESESDLSELQAKGWEAHSKEGDPLFTSPSSNNLHIGNSSPAVNAGKAVISVTSDIDGDNRTIITRTDGGTASVEIGADEL